MHLLLKDPVHEQELAVYDTDELYGEKGHFRVLQFSGNAVQGALDLINPDRIVFEYPRAILHLMEYNNPAYDKVFVIGHGIGTIPRHCKDKQVKVAELNASIVDISRTYFGYHEDNVVIGDGRTILAAEASHGYDYIVLDAFSEQGTPPQFITRPFFGLCREKLDGGGAVIMNVMGRGGHDQLVNAIYTTVQEEFSCVQAFCLPSDTPGDLKNIIIMGSDRPVIYQSRHMAGFAEIELGQGHVLWDRN